jgi:MSHA biogenesis protein MshI
MRLFPSKGRKQPGWLAIDVQPAQVDLVHVRRGVTGRPEIGLCDSYKVEGGAAETLARLRKEHKLDQYRCTTLLRFADYQLHLIDAPSVPRAELKNAVRWRVKDIIDYPLDQATVDVFSVPDAKGSIENPKSVYAVSARNDSVGKTVRPFNESNVSLESVDIPALAQRNIARLHEQEGRGLAVLAFYDECGKLTISAGGELFMTRRVEVTRDQLLEANEDRRHDLFDRIALELQRSLDHFDRQYAGLPVVKLLLAPLPAETGLQAFLASNIYVPVEPIDLAAVMDFPAVPELKHAARQSQCFALIGAALRDENGTGGAG